MLRLPRALAPLRSGGYRLLALSLALSLFSQGLWAIALVWQVVELGAGPAVLGVVAGASAVGMLASTLIGGALADRVPQRRILVAVGVVDAVSTGAVALLSLVGGLATWHLGVVSALTGIAMGLYYPAYSALVPSLVPAHELLAANGLEGMVRPLLAQAAGPAAAGFLVAATSPGVALAATAVSAALAAVTARALPALPVRRERGETGLLADVREGFGYMARTPWLLSTLLFAAGLVLVFIGPFEVLVPYVVTDAGGGAAQHAWVLAAFGVGGALGSVAVASLRLPRRYLTVMIGLWGVGCMPMVVFGFSPSLWFMVPAGAVMGATFQAGTVIWGTLLQRRVPPALLGRVSSLDFFTSMSLMPLSMALAGTVSEAIGLTATFLLAGLAPPVMAAVALLAARLRADELAHPLDHVPVPAAQVAGEPARAGAAWMDAGAGTSPVQEGEPWRS
ncbi:MFS transporter [Blastococcus sp. SYSU D00695]